ncbi:basal body-orientation factor 1-like [Gadus chalcogrammus]|uniref:basal body-orientation factor 1-like n=1 Tax=Gadus chalcogrammus TaxID=1042646 RepID=UPI0024C359EF|nr:basal body-orientation factor 1-like [Gadus chalcogrammus]
MPNKKGNKGKGSDAKEGKQEPKADKESDVERAKANAALWRLRLDVAEQSLDEYRASTGTLAAANQALTNQVYRSEKDMMDIMAHLKRKDAETDAKIESLEEQLKSENAHAREERENLVAEHTLQNEELEQRFGERAKDFDTIQAGLKKIEEFRKTKAKMELELRRMREGMLLAERKHLENLGRVETKFYTQKLRLEKEAEQRLAHLSELAHDEAVLKLDDASRSVFKENVRLNEALNYHIKEVEDLRKKAATSQATMLRDKYTDVRMTQTNAAQMKAYRKEIADLRAKLDYSEKAQALLVGQLLQERGLREVDSRARSEDLHRFQKLLAKRGRETARGKRKVAETELQRFFHAALSQVRQEIQASRLVYKKQASTAYQGSLREALAGRKQHPLVRTFNKNPHSTNSVYADMEEAQKWTETQGQNEQVDVRDLTWEQKEKVLMLLFAKMNGPKTRKQCRKEAPDTSREQSGRDSADALRMTQRTFMTLMPENSLPDIHK